MKSGLKRRMNHGIHSFAKTSIAAFLVVAPLIASAVPTPNFTAKIFDPKDRAKPLFTAENTFEVSGSTKTYVSTFKDAAGAVAVVETTKVSVADGKETLVSYIQEQKQLDAVGKVEIDAGQAKFTYTKEGKTKNATEKVTDDFVVGPTLVAYLKSHWEKIAKGETVRARFVAIDRLETVGFQYFKEKEKEIEGKPGLVVKMKPSSFLIAAIVDPLHFGFSKDGTDLLELEGRTVVKLQKDGKFKDFDGFTTYTYSAGKK